MAAQASLCLAWLEDMFCHVEAQLYFSVWTRVHHFHNREVDGLGRSTNDSLHQSGNHCSLILNHLKNRGEGGGCPGNSCILSCHLYQLNLVTF